ncbi:hypothetical protein, partial [Polymorphobacter multimanifer]|uniref:hypothetical protein n=1 Tax=Polymorphobacter multimanifer TaxID=1070431 RepID=UPI001A9CAFFB
MRPLTSYPSGLPKEFMSMEQRMSGRALLAWRDGQRTEVSGFEANAMLIADPGGEFFLRHPRRPAVVRHRS